MKIDVYFTPLGLGAGDLGGRAIIVVDVLRATTTIVTAVANGANAVIPAATSEQARQLPAARGDLVVICAGREKQFAIEAAYTAGRLVKAAKKGIRQVALNDAARAALVLTEQFASWKEAREDSEAALQLAEADLVEDVTFAAK